jgi:hypothetical protein
MEKLDDITYSQEVLELISKLPKEIQQFKDKYSFVINELVSEYWEPPFPKGYLPKEIFVVFSNEKYFSTILFLDGQFRLFDLELPPEIKCIEVFIDDQLGYVQIENIVALNRIDGVVFPTALFCKNNDCKSAF